MRIYVASSWRNDYQPEVVRALREVGHDVYDFRNPAEGNHGFDWADIDPGWKSWTGDQYRRALQHPIAKGGFSLDFSGMQSADACVLLLPCGRSAHLEAGWFVGAGRPLLILGEPPEAELMYAMADSLHGGLGSLLLRLQEIEDRELTPTSEAAV